MPRPQCLALFSSCAHGEHTCGQRCESPCPCSLTLNRRGKEKAAASQIKPGVMRSDTMMGSSVQLLQFKGRVPMESLEVEDIEDGRSDYHTNGITVNNGWKVRNIVKNKWFVLIAKTPQEKREWMEAVRGLKDRKRREWAWLGGARVG